MILPELVDPGTELGPLRPSVADEVGLTQTLQRHGTGYPRHRQCRGCCTGQTRLIITIIRPVTAGLVLYQLGNVVAPGC